MLQMLKVELHTHTADDLRKRYPQWDQFQHVRQQLDPNGVWLVDAAGKVTDAVSATAADAQSVNAMVMDNVFIVHPPR